MIIEQHKGPQALDRIAALKARNLIACSWQSYSGDMIHAAESERGEGMTIIVSALTGDAIVIREDQPSDTGTHTLIASALWNKTLDRLDRARLETSEQHEAAKMQAAKPDSGAGT